MKIYSKKTLRKKNRTRAPLLRNGKVLTLLFCFIHFSVVTYAQDQSFSVSLKKVRLKEVMNYIKENSNYYFLYNDKDVNGVKKVDVEVTKGTVAQVLSQALEGSGLEYAIKDDTITLRKVDKIIPKLPTTPQKKIEMFGKVTDVNGAPIPGVSVFVKGTQNGMSTNIDGEYRLEIKNPNTPVVVSFVGMKTQEIKPKQGNQDILLYEDQEMLEEVVVTGYQTISKDRATGSFAVVNPKKLSEKLQPSIMSRLEGQIAGLIQNDDFTAIRGISTLRGTQSPLVVVDNMPFEGDLSGINSAIVQNITVLKDAAAASIYGAKAANGVIVITTKKGEGDGKTYVTYDGSVRFTPTPDFGYLNLMSSEELVNLQKYSFRFVRDKYENLNKRNALNPVEELLYKHKSNLITDGELEAGLDKYRKLDNREQIKDFYLRKGIMHQHNVSLSGGSDKNRYFASVNYMGDYGNDKYSNDERISFSLRNDIKFFKWLSGDIVLAGNFTKEKGDTGMGEYYEFYKEYPSYYMLKDNNGNPLNIIKRKSEEELERLRSIGLKDETYSPIRNKKEESILNKKNYYRAQLGLNFKLLEGLNLDVKYQTEVSSHKDRKLYTKNSFFVRNMINEAAQYDEAKKKLTLNVPNGGQLDEIRGDSFSYTFRTQLNFLKEWDKHYLTALAGAERRLMRTTSTHSYYMGYDDSSLGYKPINPLLLSSLRGTESIGGSFIWNTSSHNYLESDENRFVSFYGNASYVYDKKYSFTGSIRVDESNLFGTDPKYQYRPLWSAGLGWYMAEEDFMQQIDWINRLNFRFTYGIGGNIPKDAGPFLTLQAPAYNSWIDDFGSRIKNPPNEKLRWEKTATTNIGLDFSFFDNKFGGSIDFYKKYTTDLLANRDADPTLGWDQLLLNYGTMSNKGVEVSLDGQFSIGAVQIKPFGTFSYNKNKLIDVDDSGLSLLRYTGGNASVKGHPYQSVFSFKYAGLSKKDGSPLYYTAKGEKVSLINSIDDVVYSGTRVPKYTASFGNMLSYQNFDFSFMVVYYGGHVMRGETASYNSLAPGANANRETLNVWREPGDEKKSNTVPAFTGSYIYPSYHGHQWAAADKHVVKADYVKLRDVSLSYALDSSLTRKFFIESCKFTFQVRNLLTIWKANRKGFDPEAMGVEGYGWGARRLPQPVTYTIGATINF